MGFQHLSLKHAREIGKKGMDGLVASGKKHKFSAEEGRRARLKGIASSKERKERARLEYLRANGTEPPK